MYVSVLGVSAAVAAEAVQLVLCPPSRFWIQGLWFRV
jgi:hypothetical protein